MDGGGLGRDRGEGSRVPAGSIRGVLSIPSGDAVGVSAQMAGLAAVPADTGHASDAGPVDLDCRAGCLPQGAHGTAHHAWLGTPFRTGFPERGAGSARRVTP